MKVYLKESSVYNIFCMGRPNELFFSPMLLTKMKRNWIGLEGNVFLFEIVRAVFHSSM